MQIVTGTSARLTGFVSGSSALYSTIQPVIFDCAQVNAEIDSEAWESLHSDTSRAFDKPRSRTIAVKAINHLGDEVMKVFSVE